MAFLFAGYDYLPVTHFTFRLPFILQANQVALDKCPPIGVCEVARRIVAKAALCILRDDQYSGCRRLAAVVFWPNYWS